MKVLALTEAPDHVCYRYRIAAYGAALADAGWDLESQPLSPHTLRRRLQLRKARDADVVVLQRKLLPLWQLRILRRIAKTLIYDFDDALFYRDSYSRKGPDSYTRLAHFWATIYAADAVTAGNGFLYERACEYIDPAKVHWMPTSVNPTLYPLARHKRIGSRAQLVWIGQHSTLPCLRQASSQLEAVAAALEGMRLVVICDRFPELSGVDVVPREWSSATEAHDITRADVGISWLPDDGWSRGKCGLKVLQYMAAGLPVVANRVGMHRELVDDGVSGFLADSPQEWAARVKCLADDPALRARMGAAGRAAVEGQYNSQKWGRRFAALVDRLGRPRAAEPAAILQVASRALVPS